jgi:Tfp pilus assembly protein PilV
MKHQRENPFHTGRSRSGSNGFSLVELAVTLGIGSIVLVVLGMLSFYGLQSFFVMGNCAALDDKSRLASNQITREMRQATRVVRYDVKPEGKLLVLTNSLEGYSVEYFWDAETRTVSCNKTDQSPSICLSDCDVWNASFFQNFPVASMSSPYLSATNGVGTLDLNQARIVSLSWKCSRPVAVSKTRTESAHTFRVALRNSALP